MLYHDVVQIRKKHSFLELLYCHLSENFHNNVKIQDDYEVNGVPGVCEAQAALLLPDMFPAFSAPSVLPGLQCFTQVIPLLRRHPYAPALTPNGTPVLNSHSGSSAFITNLLLSVSYSF